jgi:phage gp36-like protein
MSQYATINELAAFGLPAAATADLDWGDLDAQLVSASALADSYLSSRGYAMPLTTWGQDLTSCVCRIAAWNILVNLRGVNPEDPAHAGVRMSQQDAMQWLRDVAKGTANASIETAVTARKKTGLASVIVSTDTDDGTRGW